MNIKPGEKRTAAFYSKIKPINKVWLAKEAERNKFNTVTEFFDALLDSLRKKKKK